ELLVEQGGTPLDQILVDTFRLGIVAAGGLQAGPIRPPRRPKQETHGLFSHRPSSIRSTLASETLRPPDPGRLQSPPKRCQRRNVLDESRAGFVEANRRTSIDAFERHWLLADIEYLLIPEHSFDVASVPDASNEAPPAAVHHNSDLTISTWSARIGQGRI